MLLRGFTAVRDEVLTATRENLRAGTTQIKLIARRGRSLTCSSSTGTRSQI